MFHSRNFNDKRNYLHKRELRKTYSDKSSSFQNLLRKDETVSNDHSNTQPLTTGKLKGKIIWQQNS